MADPKVNLLIPRIEPVTYASLAEFEKEDPETYKQYLGKSPERVKNPEAGAEPVVTEAKLGERRKKLEKDAKAEGMDVTSYEYFLRAHRKNLFRSAYLFKREHFAGGEYLPISGGEAISDLGSWSNNVCSAFVIGLTILWDHTGFGGTEICVLWGAPPNGQPYYTLGGFNGRASSAKHWD